MIDPRVTRLAEQLVQHSLELGPEDKVLVHSFDIAPECVAEIVRVAQRSGAQVLTRLESSLVKRQVMLGGDDATYRTIAETEKFEMEAMTAYIALRGAPNASELSDVPETRQAQWNKLYGTPVVHETRVAKTRWVVLRWPTASMAQQAGQSTQSFEDFYFRVCTLDYAAMNRASEPLQEWMNRTDRVRIVGPGTDLQFSIRDIGCICHAGKRNIPDGECFTAPVLDSMEGVVQYNTPTRYQGQEFKNIRFEVRQGRIVDAQAGDASAKLNAILDTDEGARRFGEWSLGFNPHVLHPMNDTLFDEKIAGSFHLTPGNAYEIADNGNRSAIHWDIVCIQRPEYGGGEIYFDEVLIRKDGLFVPEALQGLNPDRLGA